MTNSAGSDTNASDRRRYSSRSSSWSSLVLARSAFVAPRHFEARRVSSLFRRIPIGEPPRAFAPACQEPVMSCTRRTSPRGPLLSYRHAAPGTAPSCGPWHRADSSSRPAARDGARAIRRRSRLDAPASRTRIWRMLAFQTAPSDRVRRESQPPRRVKAQVACRHRSGRRCGSPRCARHSGWRRPARTQRP